MQCTGVNSCKGTSECKSAKNSCKGMNSCKGQGYVSMTKDACSRCPGEGQGREVSRNDRCKEPGVWRPAPFDETLRLWSWTAHPSLRGHLKRASRIDWLEIITENYLVPGGKPLHYLERVRERFPLVMHGVSLSIGSTDAIDLEYLKSVARIWRPASNRTGFPITSAGRESKDGICTIYCRCPTPKRRWLVVSRVGQVQDALGRQILLENVSSYLSFHASEMTEWEFLSEVASRADCNILLDINNIYVSSVNHAFDPVQYLQAMPTARVRQFHLAGHSNMGGHLIDTHDHPIVAPVWDLYAQALTISARCRR